ncbi:MAG: hypothetical protein JEZ07_17110 [Phycisphaerae bacterium]|nr:hypothetical protein [Phycisphaerae bacterium]
MMKKILTIMVALAMLAMTQVSIAEIVMDFDFDNDGQQTIEELKTAGWVFEGEDGSGAPALPAQYDIVSKNGERTLKLDGEDQQDGTDYTVKPAASYAFDSITTGAASFRYSNSNSYCNGYMRFYSGATELFAVKMSAKDKLAFQGSTNTSDFLLPGLDNQSSPVTVKLTWTNGSFTYDAGLDNNGQPIQGTLDFKAAGDVDTVTYTLLTNNNDSREIYLYDIKIESAVATTIGEPVVLEEGATSDTFEVVLLAQPASDVVASLSADPNDLTILGGTDTLTFTSVNWSTPQVVTVQAVDDAVVEGLEVHDIAIALACTDPNFDGGLVIPAMQVTIIDNDQGTIILTQTDDSTDVNEEGATSDIYTLSLSDLPSTGTVTIDISFDDAQVTVEPTQVVLDNTSWNTGVIVTVTAIDDNLGDEGFFAEDALHTTAITHAVTNTDPVFDGATVDDVTVNIFNNDCDGPFNWTDRNQDCTTDLVDFAEFAAQWLACTVDNGVGCN